MAPRWLGASAPKHPVSAASGSSDELLHSFREQSLTIKGAEALRLWRAEKHRQYEEDEQRREAQQEELDSAMSGLTHDEIIRRLSQGSGSR